MQTLKENMIDSIIIKLDNGNKVIIAIESGIDEVEILRQFEINKEYITRLEKHVEGGAEVHIRNREYGLIRITLGKSNFNKAYNIIVRIPYTEDEELYRNIVYIKYIDGNIIDIIDFFNLLSMTYKFEKTFNNNNDRIDIMSNSIMNITLLRTFYCNKIRSRTLGIATKHYTLKNNSDHRKQIWYL